MMKLIPLLLLLVITPLYSAFGYEEIETIPDFILYTEPIVCYSSNQYNIDHENIVKTAINDWKIGLKNYTNNDEAWTIYYEFVEMDDDLMFEDEYNRCKIFIEFISAFYDDNGNIDESNNGTTYELEDGKIGIDVVTSHGLSYIQLIAVTTHELGHAFGLNHYITDDPEMSEKWDQGYSPSIMVDAMLPIGVEQIT